MTTGARSRTIVIAPDSFKGSLTSVEVARALAAGWARACPDDEVVLSPLADGGEGTMAAIEAAGGWERVTAEVGDPLGRPISASWLRSADGARAVIELAAASGLSLVAPSERHAGQASTHGTGHQLKAAIDSGVGSIVLGLGGSATTDGGQGILDILDMVAREVDGDEMAPGGDYLWRLGSLDIAGLDPRLADVDLQVACDVTNPLLGPTGAAAIYGPQKGASPKDVEHFEVGLGRWADLLEAATGRQERDTPGAGAAGGVGFALLTIQDRFRSFELRPGVDLVMEATGFSERLARASLVITGEGRIDAQTAFGKTALGVARRAQMSGVPCIAVGGGVEPEGIDALAAVGAVAVPVTERPQTVEEAMAAGTAPLERCGERLARLVALLD